VEVFLDNEDQLGEAFELLGRLCESVKIQGFKLTLNKLWTEEEGTAKVIERVSESTHRVALSLFRNWPNAKRVGDIQDETGLSQGSVSNILAGRQGGRGEWFTQEEDSWNLSEEGLAAISESIAPTYLRVSGEED
jgi:hypothetical protein